MMEMFQYLLYTLLLELPVVLLCYRNQWKTVVPVTILLNFFTWPLLTLFFYNTHIPLLILEIAVFITEANMVVDSPQIFAEQDTISYLPMPTNQKMLDALQLLRNSINF